MKETIKDLIYTVKSSDKEQIFEKFNLAMKQKISEKIELKKKEIAKTLFKKEEQK